MEADKNNLCSYNKRLQPFADKLRKEMTKGEARLWKYVLLARKMKLINSEGKGRYWISLPALCVKSFV